MNNRKNTIHKLSNIKRNKRIQNGDVLIPIITICLAIFGTLMVYSSSYYNAEKMYNDKYYFFKKQAVGFLLGLIALFVGAKIDYQKLASKIVGYIIIIFSIIILGLVFVPRLGISNYGATRWIGFAGITIQPSELAKYGFIIFSAGYISRNIEKMRTFIGIIPILLSGGMICLLIMLEPNMSVTMCVGMLMIGIIFLAGIKIKYLFIIGVPIILCIPVLIIAEPYRLLRLSAFIDPWASPKEEGYQLIQSLYALGNGGWFGTGLFKSRQKYRFLPFSESDFILSVIGEELGFFGIMILFIICGLLIYRGIKTAAETNDFFSYILASGITLIYGIQTVINALVVSGSIPPTGLPLPLISSGNTSLIVTMFSMGLLYKISKVNKRQ